MDALLERSVKLPDAAVNSPVTMGLEDVPEDTQNLELWFIFG